MKHIIFRLKLKSFFQENKWRMADKKDSQIRSGLENHRPGRELFGFENLFYLPFKEKDKSVPSLYFYPGFSPAREQTICCVELLLHNDLSSYIIFTDKLMIKDTISISPRDRKDSQIRSGLENHRPSQWNCGFKSRLY
jgi:hypothetical protein